MFEIRSYLVTLNMLMDNEDDQSVKHCKSTITELLRINFDDLDVDFIIETLNKCGRFISVGFNKDGYVINSNAGPVLPPRDSMRDALADYLEQINPRKKPSKWPTPN